MSLKTDVLKIVAATSLMRTFAYGSLWAFLILYLTTRLHIPLAIAGLYLLISGVTGAIFQVVSGAMSDSFGRKRIMMLGQAGQGVAFMLLGLTLMTVNVFFIIAVLIVQSICSGMVFSSFNAMIADVLDPNERFRGYAIQRATANIGWGIGPAIGGFLYVLNFYTYSFLFIGVSLIFIIFLINKIPETNVVTKLFRFSDIPSALLNRKFLLFSIAGFLSFLVFGQLNSTYPVYEMKINNISPYIIGLTWTMNGLMVGALQYHISKLAKVKNAYYFLIFGILIYGFGYMMLVFYPDVTWLFISMITITVGELIYSATVTASAVNMAPEKEKGKYSGTFGFFTSIGRASGPFYGGLIFSITADYYFKWGSIFGTAIVASVLYLTLLFMIAKLSYKKIKS